MLDFKSSISKMQYHNFELRPYIQGFCSQGTIFIGMTDETQIAILLIHNFDNSIEFTDKLPSLIKATTRKMTNFFGRCLFQTRDAYETILDDTEFIMLTIKENDNTDIINTHITKILEQITHDVECLDTIPKHMSNIPKADRRHYIVQYCYQSDIIYTQSTKGQMVFQDSWMHWQLKSINDNNIRLYWYAIPKEMGDFVPIPQHTIAILYNISVNKENQLHRNSYTKIVNTNAYNIDDREFMMLTIQQDTLIMWNFHTKLISPMTKMIQRMKTSNNKYINC